MGSTGRVVYYPEPGRGWKRVNHPACIACVLSFIASLIRERAQAWRVSYVRCEQWLQVLLVPGLHLPPRPPCWPQLPPGSSGCRCCWCQIYTGRHSSVLAPAGPWEQWLQVLLVPGLHLPPRPPCWPLGAVAAGVAGARSILAATTSVLAPAGPWEQWLEVLLVPGLHLSPRPPCWPLGAVAAGVAGARSTLAATASVLAPAG
eukprot:gene12457-15664_t